MFSSERLKHHRSRTRLDRLQLTLPEALTRDRSVGGAWLVRSRDWLARQLKLVELAPGGGRSPACHGGGCVRTAEAGWARSARLAPPVQSPVALESYLVWTDRGRPPIGTADSFVTDSGKLETESIMPDLTRLAAAMADQR